MFAWKNASKHGWLFFSPLYSCAVIHPSCGLIGWALLVRLSSGLDFKNDERLLCWLETRNGKEIKLNNKKVQKIVGFSCVRNACERWSKLDYIRVEAGKLLANEPHRDLLRSVVLLWLNDLLCSSLLLFMIDSENNPILTKKSCRRRLRPKLVHDWYWKRSILTNDWSCVEKSLFHYLLSR